MSAAGNLAGRTVIDATNALRTGAAGLELALGFSESGAEGVAALANGGTVFKTMNQLGFELMVEHAGFGACPIMFIAGDDAARKPTVLRLADELGSGAVDAGGLTAARLLERFAMLRVHMALNRKEGRDRAFAWLKPGGTVG